MNYDKILLNAALVFLITLLATFSTGQLTNAGVVPTIAAILTAAVAALLECKREIEGQPPNIPACPQSAALKVLLV